MWKDTDAAFLYKQLHEMRQHKRVVSNRLGSALFYGASVGFEIGVYGDPMILEADRAVLGGMERQSGCGPRCTSPPCRGTSRPSWPAWSWAPTWS